jgi:hypothetical protein
MRRWCGALMSALLALGQAGASLAAVSPSATSATPATFEERVKAGFLYQFAAKVEWPPQAFSGHAAPLTICIMGNDALHQALGEILQSRKIGGRALVARRIKDIPEIRGCQILFAGKSQEERLPEILETVRGKPILTVGETADFARLGGLINFTLINNRVAFEINADAASRSNLVLSPKLLDLGRIVHTGDEHSE